jgi:[glutamine synthetase] adenylyltransferase / [glutamine synthetase]-adenylyl-L-tyrosine phosphorylase
VRRPERTPPGPPEARLASLGLAGIPLARRLLAELAARHGWDGTAWDAVFAAARAAPDSGLFVLNLARLSEALPPALLDGVLARADTRAALGALLGGSEFLPERIARHPEIVAALFRDGSVARRAQAAILVREAVLAADRCGTEGEIKAALRRIKLREMTRIAARDLSWLSPLSEVMEDLSALAAAVLEGAVRFSRRKFTERFGLPLVDLPGEDGRVCGFVVMGMGKLGAGELNFSSDIDIVYLYETDRGMTAGGRDGGPITLHEYFVRLSEWVTRIVSEVTEEGFTFRVDLRLRPEGTRGDLATSLRSAEIYYESWGQAWERGAMIKARPVAGDLAVGEEFLRIIAPFVYRKYLDFTSIEEIREMKDRIDAARARSRTEGRDLKLGMGGIREIEFFVQAHQLIYGGKNPSLRLRETLEALGVLARMGIVSWREGADLRSAYMFLRALEHRIQVFQERQTHALPRREEDLVRLARAMGVGTPEALLAAVDRHTAGVRAVYDRLFKGAPREGVPDVPPEVLALLDQDLEGAEASARLARMGFADPETARRRLAILREGPPHVRLPPRARRYLEKIVPPILARVVAAPNPDMALAHMERFLTAVGARTMLYALLHENRKVVDALVSLFGSSPFLSGYFLRHPELLDTFLRRDLSVPLKNKFVLRKELGEILAVSADLEQEMDALRRFKNLETLRIGMHDLAGELSLEEGLFQLSALAEVVLSAALGLARREATRRYGIPIGAEGFDEGKEAAFCVLGMGKLGGEELSYHGDLDIIFLYSGAGETVPGPGTDSASFRSVSNHEYFAKVAQRLISILTTVTREGYAYRLDMRLRPSGNAGPLVTSFASFKRYHEQSAQLWERQALIKSRFVAGDREFGKEVENKIAELVFERPLPPDAAEEIHRLRMRMETEIGRERSNRLDLKVGRGGMVDVEFAAQHLQLVHGPHDRSVRVRPTLKALFELRRAGMLSEEDFGAFDEGYRFLRALEVRERLARDASIEKLDPSELSPELLERYRKETENVRRVYRKVLGLVG